MADLYFASQADADRYTLEQQIAVQNQTPVRRITRSTAPRAEALERLERSRDALFAPIYKLSDDLLREIFVAATLDHGYSDSEKSLNLSQVVSRWRRVVLETPSLWTSVYLNTGWGTRFRRAHQLLCPRSQALPLLVTVLRTVPSTGLHPPPPLVITPVFDSLSNRCKALRLQGSTTYHFIAGRPIRAGLMSALEELIVIGGFLTSFRFLDDLSNVPNLKSLALDKCVLHRAPGQEGSKVPVLPNLDSLRIEHPLGYATYVFWNEFPPHIIMPSLRMFHLDTLGVYDGVKSFRHPLVTSFHLSLELSITSLDVLIITSNFPALEHLALAVKIDDYGLAAPSWPGPVPPLTSINLLSSTCVDKLARFLVDTTTTEAARRTLKSVHFSSSDVSPETRQWVSERVSVDAV